MYPCSASMDWTASIDKILFIGSLHTFYWCIA
jgi:hypothetical protein